MMTNRGYKGQAVMEYLITYGLALFVILIVLAILVAVVLPSLRAPETCQFTQPGFACNSKPHIIVADGDSNVRILFQLDNTQGRSIEINGVSCLTTAVGNVRKTDVAALADLDPAPTQIPMPMTAGSSLTLGGPGANIEAPIVCKNEDGTTTMLGAGSSYKGAIAITYGFTDDVPGAPERLAVATVTGSVQAE